MTPGLPVFDLMAQLYFKAGKPELIGKLLGMMVQVWWGFTATVNLFCNSLVN